MCQENIKEQFDLLYQKIEKQASEFDTPKKFKSLQGFFIDSWKSIKFILSEKENILFALLQLVIIALGYYLCVQVIDWIPKEIWEDENYNTILELVLSLWCFCCIGLVAYPVGILTACMGASYILHREGRESTILECLKIVLSKSWPLWIFTWFDGWITVNRILDSLPKKNDMTPSSVKILKELIYQVWKIATLGIMPALVYGRSITESCKDSLLMLKQYFIPLGKLRIGYSIICLIIVVCSYLSLVILFPHMAKFIKAYEIKGIFCFYLIVGVPLLMALFGIFVIFRPLYIISATRIYIDYASANKIERRLPEPSSKALTAFVCFIVVAVIIFTVVLFKDQLGITYVLKHNL